MTSIPPPDPASPPDHGHGPDPGHGPARRWPLGCCLALIPILAGCLVGPTYRTPPATNLPPHLGSKAATSTPTTPTNTPPVLDAEWWRAFHDPLLDQLQSQASTNNLDLRRAEARLREARALWNEARFDLAPTVRANASYENVQASVATSPANASRENRHNEVYRAGFDATWELDLFGRVRRNVEATRATVAAVEAVRDDVLVSVRAEVAANYLTLRGLQNQLEVTRANATNQAANLKLVETLRDGGRATQLDVARASAQLNATLAASPPFEASIDRAIHHLGVLCGRPPRDLADSLHPHTPIPTITGDITPPDPAELLRRRPDIRAAERNLAAATARIGVEVADLFPRVTVNGRVAMEASRLGRFDDGGTDAWGFGPRISWAGFDIGRVRQRVKAASAKADGALTEYERTVLLALEETENALVNLDRQARRLALLRAANGDALQATTLARQRYEDGITDFLTVLDAERVLLVQSLEVSAAEANVGLATVGLYKALGGGWKPAAAPESPPK